MLRYLQLPENKKGRDLIGGDLHACVDLLYRQLDAMNFDQAVDRLMLVGDLPDRGPDSLKTLELLKAAWAHIVPGNHDLMMLTFMGLRGSHKHRGSDFLANGGDWILHLTDAEQERLQELAQLMLKRPLILTVDGETPYNVVHGDLTHLKLSQDEVTASEEIDQAIADEVVWSRDLVHTPERARQIAYKDTEVWLSNEAMIPSLNLTYVGHTILRAPMVHKSHVYIDQGAYVSVKRPGVNSSAGLTIIDHQHFSRWLKKQI